MERPPVARRARGTEASLWALAIASLLVAVAASSLGGDTASAATAVPDCGASSLASLAELVGAPIPSDRLTTIATAMPEPGPSMLDIKQAAEGQGIALNGIGGTLGEVAALGGPAIIHLTEPDHFVVLARLSGESAPRGLAGPARLLGRRPQHSPQGW